MTAKGLLARCAACGATTPTINGRCALCGRAKSAPMSKARPRKALFDRRRPR